MKTRFLLFAAAVFLLACFNIKASERFSYNEIISAGPDSGGVAVFGEKNDPWVEKELSGMTLEEKAAQLVFPRARGSYESSDSPDMYRLEHLVKDVKVGGLIFFNSGIYDQSLLINKLQRISKVPLLIASDFERGVAMRAADATVFPYNMGLGAADDSALTYKMGRIIADEGKAIGVQQNYSPVSDVNNNPRNPIINVRSFGDNDKLVERLSLAMIKGLQDGGMIATAKHFPGHGNTDVDSHRDLPVISGSSAELNKVELPPFQSDINHGVMSFMIGHLAVPALEPDTNLPSTLSKNIITGLLKDKMGFKGLIVTDAMNMHAITNSYNSAQAAVMAIQAGNDAVLYPENSVEAVNAIVDAVKKGEISESRLDYSVRKILLAKKWSGLNNNKYIDIDKIPENVGTKAHWDIADELARKSITVVRDEDHLIPLSSDPSLKYASINLLDSPTDRDDRFFNMQLRGRVGSLKVIRISPASEEKDFDEALSSAKNSDVIILSAYLKVRAYEGNLLLNEKQTELVNKILDLGKPVVMLAHGNPYILADFKNVKTYVCNYGDTEVSEKALAQALFGESDITGKLPITIPGTDAVYGTGLQIKQSALRNESMPYSPEESEKFAGVDSVVNAAIQDSAFPGAVLLVAQNGKILHEKAYGHYMYDINSGPVTTKTMYDLASLTKVTATTTAAMICYDRGLFKLDDKVAKYLPAFGKNGKENVTIRNLLVHDSGLRPDIKSYRAYDSVANKTQAVYNEIFNDSLVYPTGSKMVYSDLNMITMAKIIETVTGKTLDQFTKEEVFDPMGMKSTMFNPPKSLVERIAPTEDDNYWRHRQIRGTVHDETSALMGGVAGHAGLFSDAGDLAKLLQMELQKGYYQGKRYIKASTIEMWTKKQSDLSTRALGWDTKSPEHSSSGHLFSPDSYGHTGFTGTSLWTDPERNLFVVFLTNRVYPTRKNLKILRVRPKVHDAVIKAIEK